MNIDSSRLSDEMAVFADLGTPPPKVEQKGRTLVFRMCRNGDEVVLGFHELGEGKVIERCGDSRRTHASYSALLASERFGDLRRWARTQSMLLRDSLADIRHNKGIEVKGSFANDHNTRLNSDELDERLVAPPHCEDSTKVMLIDGPAGIGKTKFIEMIALARASTYTQRRRPLILHVQSRGRILSYLQDLMAFSLQRLRLSVTFDQMPILARHGLVTLAIDGFDELGDPNGYDSAWSQINETVSQLRGQGTLILAGRETFIGLRTLKAALTGLREQDVHGFTLQPPSADQAKRWLRRKGWQKNDIKNISDLLDGGSYALRPFFLAQLTDREIARSLPESQGSNLTPILVDVMLRRESGKFGKAVDAVLDEEERGQFAHRLLSEAARYMADEQTEVIDEVFLAWLVEAALPKQVDPDVLALLKNRAGVIAFLTSDDSPSYRRFAHSQLLNYFLGTAAIDALANDDVPKFVRRNVLSADFLSVFVDVFQHIARQEPGRCCRFFQRAAERAANYQPIDRGARNLGAWLIASLPTMADINAGEVLQVERLDVDETIIKGTLGQSTVRNVVVNQLDIRAADLRESVFENCTVKTAIVDGGTRVSPSFPTPERLRLQNTDTTYDDEWDPTEIREWLRGRGHKPTDIPQSALSTRHEAMLRLLDRACRSSSFWIPEETETRVDRFVNNPLWPKVLEALNDHGFIHKKRLAASGPNSRFVHIRQPGRILANDSEDGEVAKLYDAVAKAAQ